jgi:hypothetical protein
VDAIAYSSMAGYHGLAAAQLAIAREHAGIYDRVIFHGRGDFDYLVDDRFRCVDPGNQAEVQSRMLEIYSELAISVERVECGG